MSEHSGPLPRGLRYSSDEQPGLSFRQNRGKSCLCYPDGNPCKDEEINARVKALVIPPNWTELWICQSPNGHLQATGRDAKGRKQYIYHERFVDFRQNRKFSKMVEFAQRLPELREEVARQLRRRTWDRERMLALMVQLLDRAYLRIGNERYLRQNETYGLSTLRRKHLIDEGDQLRICFKGKSGQFRQVSIANRRLSKLVRELSALPGYELFKYRDEDGKVQTLDSADVNEYLHLHMGEEFSAKDFRTWAGSTLAVRSYPQARIIVESKPRAKVETEMIRLVSQELGNTMSVCKTYYIHPLVLAEARKGKLPSEPWPEAKDACALSEVELYTLNLLQQKS